MTDEEFTQVMALGHEVGGIEFKGPGPLNARKNPGPFVAQIVKAILGMANRRDGGIVIIGVEDNNGALILRGVPEGDIASWTYDKLASQIANYADPAVNFDLETKRYNGNRYVVIVVEEFNDIPVLCKLDSSSGGTQILRDGACYVRPRRKPETTEIPTQADMRDLLDLATVKWVRRHADWAQRAGILPLESESSVADNEALFDQDARDIL